MFTSGPSSIEAHFLPSYLSFLCLSYLFFRYFINSFIPEAISAEFLSSSTHKGTQPLHMAFMYCPVHLYTLIACFDVSKIP